MHNHILLNTGYWTLLVSYFFTTTLSIMYIQSNNAVMYICQLYIYSRMATYILCINDKFTVFFICFNVCCVNVVCFLSWYANLSCPNFQWIIVFVCSFVYSFYLCYAYLLSWSHILTFMSKWIIELAALFVTMVTHSNLNARWIIELVTHTNIHVLMDYWVYHILTFMSWWIIEFITY